MAEKQLPKPHGGKKKYSRCFPSLSFGAVLSLQLGNAHPQSCSQQCWVGDAWLAVTSPCWVLWTDKLLHMYKYDGCHS